MARLLRGNDNFGDKSLDDRLQHLETLIRALRIPNFDVFATLVQNTARHILSTYCEDYNLYEKGNIFYFAGLFLNDINRNFNVCLDLPRSLIAIGDQINLVEPTKKELNEVTAFEDIAKKFKMLMKFFQDAVFFAQYYRGKISYSPNCPITIAYEGVKQFKEDVSKILPALKQNSYTSNNKAGSEIKTRVETESQPLLSPNCESIKGYASGIETPKELWDFLSYKSIYDGCNFGNEPSFIDIIRDVIVRIRGQHLDLDIPLAPVGDDIVLYKQWCQEAEKCWYKSESGKQKKEGEARDTTLKSGQNTEKIIGDEVSIWVVKIHWRNALAKLKKLMSCVKTILHKKQSRRSGDC